MIDRKATLSVGDKSIELPVYSGTVGPDVIDVRGLVQHPRHNALHAAWPVVLIRSVLVLGRVNLRVA